MGSKKRNPVEEAENLIDTNSENVAVKKKFKKDKENEKDTTSVKPMQRHKERKAMDKLRHRGKKESNPNDMEVDSEVRTESKAKEMEGDSKVDEITVQKAAVSTSGGAGGLPEFHIDVFKDLASADVSVREAAVERLVTELKEVQQAYEMVDNKEVIDGGLKLEAEKDDGLNNCAPSLRYAVRRLIRGASSSRECARQGFALGLTVLLGTISSIKVDALLKLIVELLEVSSSMKGQEIKDCLLGRLFSYGALARSGRLPDTDNPLLTEFTVALLDLVKEKQYLREPAVAVILDLVEKLSRDTLLDLVHDIPSMEERFDEAMNAGNPDALLLALKIREKMEAETILFGNMLPVPFTPGTLFASDYLPSIVKCLQESSFCQPRVHSIWPVLVNILLPDTILQAENMMSASNPLKKHKKNRKSNSSVEETAKSIQNFCEVIIEGSLLLSSHDRKHLAFDVLLLLLPRLPASYVPIVLSYKLVQCLIDVLSTKDSWLYKVAQHFLKELLDWVGDDDVRRVAVIVALQKHSNGKFDNVTRTKTIKNLMGEFKTEAGCMLFIQHLEDMFVDGGHDSEAPSDQSQTTDDNSEIGSIEDKDSPNSDFIKIWIVESLPSILKCLKLDAEAKFRVQKEILKFLAVQGLFSASLGSEVTSFELEEKFRWPKAATSSGVCKMCIEQIQQLLASAQKIEGARSLANGLEPSDLGSYFMWFLSILRNIPSVSLFRSLSTEDEKAFEKLKKMETRLSKEERNCEHSGNANRAHALRYLLIQLLLQVFLRPGEFADAISELVICCKKAFSASDLPESSGEDESDNDEKPELMDVLVDTLLSLLPQSSAPLRAAIEQVFKHFCSDITNDGLLQMLRVIKKDLKPPRRADANSEEDDDDDEDFLDIEEDEEEIDEAEMGETGEVEEQTDDSEAVVEEAEEPEKESPEDSDGSDMDDDAMFRMDTYLAQIFREKKNQAGNDTAQSQLVLFKLRVLSLLEIYLQENPGKSEVVTVYSNLCRALVNPHTAEISVQLGERIWGILQKKILKAKEFPKGETVQIATLEDLLEKNLKLASKPFKGKKLADSSEKKQPVPSQKRKQSAAWKRHKMMMSLAQDSTFWILKIIDARNLPEPELKKCFDIIEGVLVGYLDDKRSQIKSGFLKEIFRRKPWIGQHFFGFLLEKCSTPKSEFRRVKVLDLLMETLKLMVSSSSDDASKKILKNHLKKISHLIKELATNMPETKSRQAEVRKFCSKIFQILSSHDLAKSFLKDLSAETQAACESKLGQVFLNLKKTKE
ncbi:DNA polymerase V family [Euphorbia peplus]|nr:DNA polymerase V family [Euphorbia peplus]